MHIYFYYSALKYKSIFQKNRVYDQSDYKLIASFVYSGTLLVYGRSPAALTRSLETMK